MSCFVDLLDCLKSCTSWTTIFESIEKQTLFQSRQCNNTLLNSETTTEYQTVSSTPVNCSSWEVETFKQIGNTCTYYEKKLCVNSLGETIEKFQRYNSTCAPQPSGTFAPQPNGTFAPQPNGTFAPPPTGKKNAFIL